MTHEFSPSNFINRELSWVAFNRRVLEEAKDPTHPPLERAKFLAIFATNLDEFYMIRFSGLMEQIHAGVIDTSPDGLTPEQTVDLLNKRLAPLIADHSSVWLNDVKPLLEQNGIRILEAHEMNDEQRAFAKAYYDSNVHAVLTPLAFDPGHPFPHISNLSLSLAVVIEEKGRQRFARVKVPPSLPRLLPLNICADDELKTQRCFVWLDQVIVDNIGALFPHKKIVGTYEFRVTRDADLEIAEDEADDLRVSIERSIADRRFGNAVRLEIASDMPDFVRDILVKNLKLTENDVWRIDGHLALNDLWELYRLPMPNLKDAPFSPRVPHSFEDNADLFGEIRKRDILLHHPYDSFAPVVAFIQKAARDPQVLAIKMTLYRVGANSPIVEALMEAMQNEKQVAVLVELKARFDEENNLAWTKRLQDLGAHVVYGFPGIKVHSKIALVVRKESDDIRRYVHLGSGNYNAATARVYTDLGLFTCRDEIGKDATDLFNYLTGYSEQREYRELFVAPVNLRQKLSGLIERECEHHLQHKNGHLFFKMNALIDPDMIALLYRASQIGVKVDLLVRGMCSLTPGVPNISENIRVRSIVGRFLEHSRVYYFHNNGQEEIYVGSADLMQRNLDRRVETVFPIHDAELRQRIMVEVLELGFADNVKSRALDEHGCYWRVVPKAGEPKTNSQLKLLGVSSDE
jgi:polyphosphate kinase